MNLKTSWIAAAVGLLLAGCSGTGPERAEVRGAVSLNGVPLAEGAINFFPIDGTTGPEAGAVIKDGQFHIPRDKGPVVGKHRVELRAFGKTGRKIQDATAPAGTLTDEIGNIVPAEYNSDSKLIREVTSGGNDFEFDISTRGKSK